MRRGVVITGMGAITPLGIGAGQLFARWADGRSGIVDGLGRCADFVARDVLTKREANRTDRFAQFAIAASHEAVKAAALDAAAYAPERIGCIIGTGIGGLATIEAQHTGLCARGEDGISALGVPMMMSNAASGAVAMRYGFTGPNWGVVSACAAGAHAIGTALRLVDCGEADAVVTGGAEAALTPMALAGFSKMGATSKLGVSRPFDAQRDGFVVGEGAGILVLEAAETAAARGAPILAEVVGYGATSDAYHLTAPAPDGLGAREAMCRALREAGLVAADVDYVNAHGTSTPLNDRIETDAIKAVFGPAAAATPVSSLKSAIGHLLGAGGAVEAIATVLALRARVAPPTLNYEEPEEGLDLDYVPTSRPLAPSRRVDERLVALTNSFGFGGHNAVLCVVA